MNAHVTLTPPTLHVGNMSVRLTPTDIGELIVHLRAVEARPRHSQKHVTKKRLTRGLIATTRNRIALATKTGKAQATFDPEQLADEVVDARVTTMSLRTISLCGWCGEEYDRASPRQLYCDTTCGTRAKAHRENPRITLTCKDCETPFMTRASNRSRKFCDTCRKRRNRASTRASMRTMRGTIYRKCLRCSTEFVPQNGRQTFCTPDCQKQSLADRKREAAEKRPCRVCAGPLGAPKISVHPECRKGVRPHCSWCGQRMVPNSRGRPLHPECVEPNDRALARIGIS